MIVGQLLLVRTDRLSDSVSPNTAGRDRPCLDLSAVSARLNCHRLSVAAKSIDCPPHATSRISIPRNGVYYLSLPLSCASSLPQVASVAIRTSQSAAALTAPPSCQGDIPVPPRLSATATATAPLSTRPHAPSLAAPIVLFAYSLASSAHSHALSDTSCLSQSNFVASFLFLPSFCSQYFSWRIPAVAHTGPF